MVQQAHCALRGIPNDGIINTKLYAGDSERSTDNLKGARWLIRLLSGLSGIPERRHTDEVGSLPAHPDRQRVSLASERADIDRE